MNICEETSAVDRILLELKSKDYSIVDLFPEDEIASSAEIEREMLKLAETLKLGGAFTPKLYAKPTCDDFTKQGFFNHVGGPATRADHPAFSTNSGLDLHTDGTLNPLGEVRISILACVSEAAKGGQSVLFRAAALGEAMAANLNIEPLYDPRALRRHTTIGAVPQHDDGPVLQKQGDEVLARYCTTPRDEWRVDDVPGLANARATYEQAAQDEPDWTHVFLLKRGQALVMDNARVSHGRTAFEDNPKAPRHMVRALFRQYPSL